MNKKEQKINIVKLSFGLVLAISFLMIYIYNTLTPLMSDDLMFDTSIYHSVGDVFREEYKQYMTWNGRSVLQLILRFSMLMPKPLFNVLNSLCYLATTVLIYKNIKGRKQYDVFLLILINLCIWVFCVDFSQTILWVAGACNYLWGIFIILGYLTLYRYYLEKDVEIKYPWLAGISLFVTGILSGWGNENTSGGMILIVILLSIKYFLENKKITKVALAGIIGNFVGFLFLLLAPGNVVRGEMAKMAETYTGLAAYISRGLKVLKAMDQYLLLYVIVICFLGAYFYYRKEYKLVEFVEVAIFSFAAIATAAVLIMTPEPMPRAYFGANIYMMIAALQIVQMIREEDVLLISLKTGGIVAATIAMMFMYVEEGSNLVRIRREVELRETYILEQRAQGESDVILPMLRPEFESRYSMAHSVDISNEEDNWNNDIYRNAYLVDKIEVLPWDEWEKRIE